MGSCIDHWFFFETCHREPTDLDEYLPLLTTSKTYVRHQTVDIPALTSHYVETTDSTWQADPYSYATYGIRD